MVTTAFSSRATLFMFSVLAASSMSTCRAFVPSTLAHKNPTNTVKRNMIANILDLLGGPDKSQMVSPENALPGRSQKMANIEGLRHYVLGNKLEEVPEGYEVAGTYNFFIIIILLVSLLYCCGCCATRWWRWVCYNMTKNGDNSQKRRNLHSTMNKQIKMPLFRSVLLSVLLLMSAPLMSSGLHVPSTQIMSPRNPTGNTRPLHLVFQLDYASTSSNHHYPLFSTANNNDDGNQRRGQKLLLALRRCLLQCAVAPQRFLARFRSLSNRGKARVAMQLLAMALVFGGMAKGVYTKYYQPAAAAAGPPIELPYSSFLDLVEQSGSTSTSRGTAVAVDNVRIGPEKVMYRLTQQVAGEEEPKSMVCYTHKVEASPELIDSLHKNGIPFAAAPRQRANTAGMALRTVILGFYMLILWRMYQTFSRNSGSGDVPGKLASQSSLPLASFSEIQGIDDAKVEVMELVDTLRNPEKYSILGARAPTGLLLEGTYSW
jgi:hypothetical protein